MRYQKLLWGILVLLLLFIWGNSCLPVSISAQESGKVLELLRPFLELFMREGELSHNLVRKLAHVTEFAALGVVIALLLLGGKAITKRRISLAFVFGLTTAFLDESIQMFSGRGDQIRDVWIDLFGVLLGVSFVLLLLWLRRSRQRPLPGDPPG